jgi:hypothetical protein
MHTHAVPGRYSATVVDPGLRLHLFARRELRERLNAAPDPDALRQVILDAFDAHQIDLHQVVQFLALAHTWQANRSDVAEDQASLRESVIVAHELVRRGLLLQARQLLLNDLSQIEDARDA